MSSSLFADEYNSTWQAVNEAVLYSACTGEIVHIFTSYQDYIKKLLFAACEDYTSTGEYWGKDLDGRTWRVHVES